MNLARRRKHRSSGVLVLLAIGFLFADAATVCAADYPPLDPETCHPTAMVTADNDIRLDGDKRAPGKLAAVPAAVIGVLRAAAKRFLAELPPGTADGLTCEDLFPSTYRIAAPQHRELYVSEVYAGLGIGYFELVLYDPATGAATRHPPRIWAKSIQSFGANDQLMKKPFVSFAQLFQNQPAQIVFEERVHNGNMYNAVVYHYFDVGPGLAMTRVLALETRLLALNPEGDIFIRELTQVSPTRLRLETFRVQRGRPTARIAMGYVILERSVPRSPLQVAERHPKDAKSFDCLVTCMPEPPGDDTFIREGNTFHY